MLTPLVIVCVHTSRCVLCSHLSLDAGCGFRLFAVCDLPPVCRVRGPSVRRVRGLLSAHQWSSLWYSQLTAGERAEAAGNTLSAHAELILPLNSLLTVLTASYHPAHKRRQTNAGLKLVQRRRRWSNIKATLVHRIIKNSDLRKLKLYFRKIIFCKVSLFSMIFL